MASFVAHGHAVNLHVYDPPTGVPAGVSLLDANRGLSRDHLFLHRKTGSPALFADLFRYRVLYEQGGAWADTDVVCLKPLDDPTQEIYAWVDQKAINNAVLGLRRGDELAAWMSECCERPNRILPYDDVRTRIRKWQRRFFEGNRRSNIEWGEYGPQGFTAGARHLGYADRALPPWHFYPICWRDWQRIFASIPNSIDELHRSYAIHLWNEMTRFDPSFDKNGGFPADSLFEQLCRRYLTSDD